jgi:hypothetical protein
MRMLAVVLACFGALGGLLLTLVTSGPDDPAARYAGALVVGSAVALLGAVMVGRGLPGWGALVLLEALVSFGLWLGDRALLPGVFLVIAALLALASRRHRQYRRRRW